ncbi:acyl carrier protein, partial [Streptomyces sp. NPDC002690]
NRPAGEPGAADPSFAERLAGLAVQQARRLVAELVQVHAASVLGHLSAATIELETAFKDLGFDSLTSVELRNRLAAATGLRLSATLAFDYPTVADLTDHLLASLLPRSPAGPGDARGAGGVEEEDLAKLRSAFASIPLRQLKLTGVLDTLLELAGVKAEQAGEHPVADDADIDAMGADELIDLLMFDEEDEG